MTAYLSQSAQTLTGYTKKVQEEIKGRLQADYYLAQRKYDGISGIVNTNTRQMLTRVGTVLVSCEHIVNACVAKFGRDAVVFGEIWHPEWKQANINGAAMRHEPSPELDFVIFDAISSTDFQFGLTTEGYGERLSEINSAVISYGNPGPLRVAATYNPGTYGTPEMLVAAVMAERGYDGIVLRDPYSPWYPGKDTMGAVIKVKPFLSFDLEVTGVEEGVGKNKGRLGALLCRFKDGKVLKVSGMTDADREVWWANPALILGKIIQVDATALSSNGSLREPRFKGIRTDKDKADF